MSVSIYYTVSREKQLNQHEKLELEAIVETYSVDKKIEKYIETGIGLNWESFCLYESSEPNIIFEGSTKLPDNSEDAIWIGISHWCEMFTNLRKSLPECKWEVRVEDHQIFWDDFKQEYDPRK